MFFIVWNCQGAGSKKFMRAARLLIKTHNPSVMALLETKVSGDRANDICKKLNFSNWIRIEAIGFSGGIWILWKEEIDLQVKFTHPQFAISDIRSDNKHWNMVIVYASPDYQLRKKLWNDLSKDKLDLNTEWMVLGDFNSVVSIDEVSNPRTFDHRRCIGMKDWIRREGLVDPGFTGPLFTWMRGKHQDTFKGARLDRVLCSTEWLNWFPDISVRHLPMINSDHAPVLIRLDKKRNCRRSGFKFQAAWTTHPEFKKCIAENWSHLDTVVENTRKLAPILEKWNKDCFGSIFKRKNRLIARLNGIQKIFATRHHNGILNLERKLRHELDTTLYQEELYWYQRSREDWIRSGDKNTKFYHAAANVKRLRKNITQLMNATGEWVQNENLIKNMIRDHFVDLFT